MDSTTSADQDQQRRERFVVGRTEHFPPGERRIVTVAGRQIGIFNIGGTLYALPNICPHQAGPVCAGDRLTGTLQANAESDWRPEWIHDGEIIMCPWHKLEYHVPTGQCLAYRHIKLRRYDVTVEDDHVVLLMPRAGQRA